MTERVNAPPPLTTLTYLEAAVALPKVHQGKPFIKSLSAIRLRALLRYDPEDGSFIALVHSGGRGVGAVAGSIGRTGYVHITIDGGQYLGHRLAWLYVMGEWPKNQIDHINRRRSDNRFANLREATSTENCRNSGTSRRNTSGYKGVSYHKASGLWRASLYLDGQQKSLGYHATPALAALAYAEAVISAHKEFRAA